MRTIAGTLTRANGDALTNVTLVFRAAKRLTAAGVPDAEPADGLVPLGTDGSYSIALVPGRYNVLLRWSAGERHLGAGDVTTGTAITLQQLLGA